MKPNVSVKELMADMIDPASDYVFDSIGTIITNEKTTEIQPRTDEDWARVRAPVSAPATDVCSRISDLARGTH